MISLMLGEFEGTCEFFGSVYEVIMLTTLQKEIDEQSKIKNSGEISLWEMVTWVS